MTAYSRMARLACAALLIGALSTRALARPDQVQYVFSGQCHGLLHWVSLLYDRSDNVVSTVIVRAKCPYDDIQSFRIFRNTDIQVNLGGRFSDIIKQSGIDYFIDGTIVSANHATLKQKGPKTVLTCGKPDIVGPRLRAEICSQFKLTARTPEAP